MTKDKQFEPNKAYPRHWSWQDVWEQVKMKNGKSIWIELELTPDLFDHVKYNVFGIERAEILGYLEIEAWLGKDNNVHLSVLVQQNMGDEDGFGVEPDDYLVGTVAPDGTFIEPLHIY